VDQGQSPSTNQDRIVFQVEVEPGTDPIKGLLRSGERELGFTGWVSLASALERVIEASESGSQQKSGVNPP